MSIYNSKYVIIYIPILTFLDTKGRCVSHHIPSKISSDIARSPATSRLLFNPSKTTTIF